MHNSQGIPWFSWNVGELCGNIGLGFAIQNNIGPMIKTNKKQEKNQYVISLTYIMGSTLYLFIAVMGGFGILGRDGTLNGS